DPVLESPRRAERGDLDRGIAAAQGVGGGEQWRGVAGRAPAGEEHAHYFARVARVARALTPERPRPRRRRSRSSRAAAGSCRANEIRRPIETSSGTSEDPPQD